MYEKLRYVVDGISKKFNKDKMSNLIGINIELVIVFFVWLQMLKEVLIYQVLL